MAKRNQCSNCGYIHSPFEEPEPCCSSFWKTENEYLYEREQ
mgnify:CR=1 FL=1